MPDMTQLADLLVKSASYYRRRKFLALDKELQDEAVLVLNRYGVLSVSALGSVVGVSQYRVEKALANAYEPKPTARGHLNPAHLTMLIYGLSLGDLPTRWVTEMTKDGTSISTIVTLTGVSERTIYRRRDSE